MTVVATVTATKKYGRYRRNIDCRIGVAAAVVVVAVVFCYQQLFTVSSFTIPIPQRYLPSSSSSSTPQHQHQRQHCTIKHNLLQLPFGTIRTLLSSPSPTTTTATISRAAVFCRRTNMNHNDNENVDNNTVNEEDKDVDSMVVLQQGQMGTLYQVQLQMLRDNNRTDDAAHDNNNTTAAANDRQQKQHQHEDDTTTTTLEQRYPYEQRIVIDSTTTNGGIKSSLSAFLCLVRFKIWWIRPIWVHQIQEIPYETIMILWKTQSLPLPSPPLVSSATAPTTAMFHLYLAVPLPIYDTDANNTIVSYTSSSFRSSGSTDTHYTTSSSAVLLCSDHPTTGIYTGSTTSNDPYALIQEGVQMASSIWQRQFRWPPQLQDSQRYLPPQSVITATTTISNNKRCSYNNKKDNAGDDDNIDGVPSQQHDNDSGNTMHTTLGWCTWNAMETNITERKIIDTLDVLLSYQKHKIPIRWMIIDDGWQDTSSTETPMPTSSSSLRGYNGSRHHTARLQSLHEDYNKFQSLSATIQQIKQQFPTIETVLVWHALHGYWLGLHESIHIDDNDESSLVSSGTRTDTIQSQLYFPKFPYGIVENDPSSLREASFGLGVGIPNDIEDFYERYYRRLVHHSHIDGVKVDVQAITSILHPPNNSSSIVGTASNLLSESSPSILLHTALATNVMNRFVHTKPELLVSEPFEHTGVQQIIPIIHCMAHSPEIFYRLQSLYEINPTSATATTTKSFFRVADDYYPDNDASHGAQIVSCAYNTLLFGSLGGIITDWDMFTTTIPDERYVRLHAIARCISGGPIYISDKPSSVDHASNKHVFEWIACDDGTTFPCQRGGVPTISSLFLDPLNACSSVQYQPLIIWNTNGDDTMVTSGIFGIFYLNGSGSWDTTKLDYVKNVNPSLSSVTVPIHPIDIPSFVSINVHLPTTTVTSFVAIRFFDQSVEIIPSLSDSINITLQPLQSESVSMIPIHQMTTGGYDSSLAEAFEFAVLGIRGKINGVGAVQRVVTYTNEGKHVIRLTNVKCCGEFAIAFRSTVVLDRETYHTTTVDVRINGAVLRPDQLHWNRAHGADHYHKDSDADKIIKSLNTFAFDVLSFDVSCDRMNSQMIEIQVYNLY